MRAAVDVAPLARDHVVQRPSQSHVLMTERSRREDRDETALLLRVVSVAGRAELDMFMDLDALVRPGRSAFPAAHTVPFPETIATGTAARTAAGEHVGCVQ